MISPQPAVCHHTAFVFLQGSNLGWKVVNLQRGSCLNSQSHTRVHTHIQTVTHCFCSCNLTQALCSQLCYSRGQPEQRHSRTEITGTAAFLMLLFFITSFVLQPFSKKAVDHVQSHLAKKQVPPTLFQVTGFLFTPLLFPHLLQQSVFQYFGLHLCALIWKIICNYLKN